jgi:glycosyltransferase involved in cell wall biosynthesis
MTAAGLSQGSDLVVVTSRASIQITDIPIKNFPPIGEFELPEYELQKLSFPPVLQMLDYIQREKFTELIISTPGPVGLTALLAAKTLGLRAAGIYHTDFPQYVRILTDDSFLETLTWNFMHWFYSQLDLIYVNSGHYRQCWIDRGIDPGKIRILPRGLDTALYHPSRRDPEWRHRFGARDGEAVLLYVGRISKEKNLDVLAAAHRKLRSLNASTRLVLVGDGPYLKTLKKALPDAHFTGYLSGLDLAKAFASADIFAFPSTTDTFGNVVLEAMASGLPCVVSDTGGPRELVREGETGFVTRSLQVESFTAAIQRLAGDAELRSAMSRNAREAVAGRDWNAAFRKFWAMSEN